MLNKLPPQNIDAEETVIASCMLNWFDAERAVDILSPDDFYRTAHGKIFTAISELTNKGEKADLIILAEKLKQKHQLEEIGGHIYLVKIIDSAPISSNIEKHCDIIKNLAIKRRIICESNRICDCCFDPTISQNELLDAAQKMIADCENRATDDKPVLAGVFCLSFIDQIQEVNQSKNGITGLRTGFDKLDKYTGGLQRTDEIIVAGRPGMGKTAFALDLAKSFTESGETVLFESMEMSESQLIGRLASKIARVDSVKFRTGGLLPEEMARVMSAMNDISEMSLLIDSPKNNDFDSIRRKIRRSKREHNIQAVIIDYLQLMFRKGDFHGRKDLEVGSMTADLKQLAKDLKIPVILLSQLNRSLENRANKRPVLSDLRESGNIEQDADLVLFLFREEVYEKDKPELKGIGELALAKHRHGPTGTIKLQWDEQTATYRNFIDTSNWNTREENRWQKD